MYSVILPQLFQASQIGDGGCLQQGRSVLALKEFYTFHAGRGLGSASGSLIHPYMVVGSRHRLVHPCGLNGLSLEFKLNPGIGLRAGPGGLDRGLEGQQLPEQVAAHDPKLPCSSPALPTLPDRPCDGYLGVIA